MKPRKSKRKRAAKTVAQVKMQGEPEKPAIPEEPASQVEIVADTEGATGNSTAVGGADRRTHPRYAFAGTVEVVAAESGARIEARLRDLSKQGCYLDISSPLPLETAANLRITKGIKSLEARARVVYTQTGKGMGLMFTAIEPQQLGTLDTWLAESRETSWLANNRRRSQRVVMKIPVRVSSQAAAGLLFEEETHTLAISAHGALIAVSTPISRGQRLTLSNVQTKAALECVVVHIDTRLGQQNQIGVEFMLPNPSFWHVAFPPKDWTTRHPDAKSRLKLVDN